MIAKVGVNISIERDVQKAARATKILELPPAPEAYSHRAFTQHGDIIVENAREAIRSSQDRTEAIASLQELIRNMQQFEMEGKGWVNPKAGETIDINKDMKIALAQGVTLEKSGTKTVIRFDEKIWDGTPSATVTMRDSGMANTRKADNPLPVLLLNDEHYSLTRISPSKMNLKSAKSELSIYILQDKIKVVTEGDPFKVWKKTKCDELDWERRTESKGLDAGDLYRREQLSRDELASWMPAFGPTMPLNELLTMRRTMNDMVKVAEDDRRYKAVQEIESELTFLDKLTFGPLPRLYDLSDTPADKQKKVADVIENLTLFIDGLNNLQRKHPWLRDASTDASKQADPIEQALQAYAVYIRVVRDAAQRRVETLSAR